MVVRKIEAWKVSLPLKDPVVFGAMRFAERDYAIVRLTDDCGVSGVGFSLARGAPVVATVAALGPRVVEADPDQSERLWEELYHASITYGQRGLALRALSLIDIALWDLRARAVGLPLYRFFGAVTERVPVSIVGGYFRDRRELEQVQAELSGYVARGFRHVKSPIGGGSPEQEAGWVSALREALREDTELALDAHWKWQDVTAAARVIDALAEYDLAWVEDPLWPEAVWAAAELRQRVSTPIAIGDEQSGRWAYQNLLEARAADIWRVDVATVGGFTELRRVAALAATSGIPISCHIYPELHVHAAASEPAVIGVEYVDPGSDIDLSYRFLAQAAEPTDGTLSPPSGPGLGIELDWEMIEVTASERWSEEAS